MDRAEAGAPLLGLIFTCLAKTERYLSPFGFGLRIQVLTESSREFDKSVPQIQQLRS